MSERKSVTREELATACQTWDDQLTTVAVDHIWHALPATPPASDHQTTGLSHIPGYRDVPDTTQHIRSTPPASRSVRAEADPWASTGDGLTPNERLSLAHKSGIEVGRAEADERLRALREALLHLFDLTADRPDIRSAIRAALDATPENVEVQRGT